MRSSARLIIRTREGGGSGMFDLDCLAQNLLMMKEVRKRQPSPLTPVTDTNLQRH